MEDVEVLVDETSSEEEGEEEECGRHYTNEELDDQQMECAIRWLNRMDNCIERRTVAREVNKTSSPLPALDLTSFTNNAGGKLELEITEANRGELNDMHVTDNDNNSRMVAIGKPAKTSQNRKRKRSVSPELCHTTPVKDIVKLLDNMMTKVKDGEIPKNFIKLLEELHCPLNIKSVSNGSQIRSWAIAFLHTSPNSNSVTALWEHVLDENEGLVELRKLEPR